MNSAQKTPNLLHLVLWMGGSACHRALPLQYRALSGVVLLIATLLVLLPACLSGLNLGCTKCLQNLHQLHLPHPASTSKLECCTCILRMFLIMSILTLVLQAGRLPTADSQSFWSHQRWRPQFGLTIHPAWRYKTFSMRLHSTVSGSQLPTRPSLSHSHVSLAHLALVGLTPADTTNCSECEAPTSENIALYVRCRRKCFGAALAGWCSLPFHHVLTSMQSTCLLRAMLGAATSSRLTHVCQTSLWGAVRLRLRSRHSACVAMRWCSRHRSWRRCGSAM